jgi:leucyl aminopeptidase
VVFLQQIDTAYPQNDQAADTILLADKTNPDALSAWLSHEEMIFLKRQLAQEVSSFCFPHAEYSLFVRFLPKEEQAEARLEQIRVAGNTALADLEHYKIKTVTLSDVSGQRAALPFIEGMLLGSYQFLHHFSEVQKKQRSLAEVRISTSDASPADIDELRSLQQAVFLTRNLVNEPYSHLDTARLAEATVEAGQKSGFSVQVLNKSEIEALNMGGLLAVNRASQKPPAFCILEWKPEKPSNEKPVVLVGKGVVYDTGGLSLKSSEGMEYMKCDMAGAAAVVGTMTVTAQNRLPVHLIGLIPITDNQVGECALAPGDVITMASGTTVEVANTDAEGRLILADALHYAKRYDPELVIDFATLTGSAIRALGSLAICYMGTAGKSVKENLEQSGWSTYERLVELPLWKEYGEELKSAVADLRNIGQGGNAGMITAGKFLEHFTDYPWLHLDIAGPAYIRAANGYRTKEGTGIGVRLMYDFLKKKYQHE